MVEKLILKLRHVDIGGTLGFACLALQAKIHDLVEPLAGKFFFRDFSREHRTQSVGPASRGVFFVEGSHIRRTHCAVQLLPAFPHAAAHLNGPDKAALAAEIQGGLWLPGFVGWANPQRLGYCRRVDNLAGIHEVLRIKGGFHLAKRLVKNGTEKFLIIGATGQSVAFRSVHRPFEYEYKIGYLVGDGDHLFDFAWLLEIDQRPDMHATHRTMAIVAGDGVVTSNDFPETFDEFRQLRGLNRGILDKSDGLLISLSSEQQPESCLAHAPDRLHLIRIERQRSRVANATRLTELFQLVNLPLYGIRCVAGVFNH